MKHFLKECKNILTRFFKNSSELSNERKPKAVLTILMTSRKFRGSKQVEPKNSVGEGKQKTQEGLRKKGVRETAAPKHVS